MGVMDRLSRLIRANVNDLIERSEDPERMLDQLLRDMQSNMTTARSQVAAMIAQEKELEADRDETLQLSTEWEQKARRAVDAGKDDLAREALRRKRDNDENAGVYDQQLQLQKSTVEKLKTQLRQLESKYQSTMSQRDALVARQRRAKAQTQVSHSLTVVSPLDPSSELDRMERRIRGAESHVAALTEMSEESFDAQFEELDSDGDIEAQLTALKAGTSGVGQGLGTGIAPAALEAGDVAPPSEQQGQAGSASSDPV